MWPIWKINQTFSKEPDCVENDKQATGYGGPFVSKLSIQKCCLCAYKSRLYRLDDQQNRFDMYHVWLDHPRWSARASTRFYENRLDFMKIDSILWKSTRFYENRLDSCHVRLDHPRWRKSTRFYEIELIRATFDSIIRGGENRLDSHSGEKIHNGVTRTKIDSIFTPLAFGIWERDWTCTRAQ